ncbi:curved DNA-binding protein CbpA [Clostridium saccharobutylicum]|nr:curved DNA-binding protein CbpA [Clostridium saccharobutylicum]
MKDYYKILNISKNATNDEIKKAFRSLAKKYHPDRNQDDKESLRKFQEVNEAYEILSKEDSRKNMTKKYLKKIIRIKKQIKEIVNQIMIIKNIKIKVKV